MNTFQKRLLKVAYGITLDPEESREIVQDVLQPQHDHWRPPIQSWGPAVSYHRFHAIEALWLMYHLPDRYRPGEQG